MTFSNLLGIISVNILPVLDSFSPISLLEDYTIRHERVGQSFLWWDQYDLVIVVAHGYWIELTPRTKHCANAGLPLK